MRPVKIRYSDVNNMGDQLSALIVKNVFNADVLHTPNYYDYDIMGVGSLLHEAFNIVHHRKIGEIADKVLCSTIGSKKAFIWGTGFIRNNEIPLVLRRKNLHFSAVRGKLSLSDIQKAGVDVSNTVLGDGGILASRLIDRNLEKKHAIGFIPHFKEQNEESVLKFINDNPDMKVINLRDDYYKVIEEIGSCEGIVSSSLHGIIVADSFRIPWCYRKFSNNPLGDGYKFNDYFSNYDLNTEQVTLKKEKVDLNDILDIYKIDERKIDEMEMNMFESMKSILKEF